VGVYSERAEFNSAYELAPPPLVTLYLVCLASNASNLRDAARRVPAKRMNTQASPGRGLHHLEQPSQSYMSTSYELVQQHCSSGLASLGTNQVRRNTRQFRKKRAEGGRRNNYINMRISSPLSQLHLEASKLWFQFPSQVNLRCTELNMIFQPILLNILLLSSTSLAQVIGAATGFAKGVTGGGSATPAYPADINE